MLECPGSIPSVQIEHWFPRSTCRNRISITILMRKDQRYASVTEEISLLRWNKEIWRRMLSSFFVWQSNIFLCLVIYFKENRNLLFRTLCKSADCKHASHKTLIPTQRYLEIPSIFLSCYCSAQQLGYLRPTVMYWSLHKRPNGCNCLMVLFPITELLENAAKQGGY